MGRAASAVALLVSLAVAVSFSQEREDGATERPTVYDTVIVCKVISESVTIKSMPKKSFSFFDILPSLITFLAVAVALWSFLHDHKRSSRQTAFRHLTSTSKEMGYLLDKIDIYFPDDEDIIYDGPRNRYLSCRKEIIQFLSLHEDIAVGIDSGIFDLDLFDKLLGKSTIGVYKRFKRAIEWEREARDFKGCYCMFEELVNKLREKRMWWDHAPE